MARALLYFKYSTFVLLSLPIACLAGSCETIWDGDAAVSSNLLSNIIRLNDDNNQAIAEITFAQIEAFYNAKEKISKLAGINPTFIICSDSDVNAFAIPSRDGSVVGVTIGMLKAVNGDPDMAAAVIGHEIAHHTRNHIRLAQAQNFAMNLVAEVLGTWLETRIEKKYHIQGAGNYIANIGSVLVLRKFSRDHEREADEYGFRYMIDSGFNPEGSIRLAAMFLRMGQGGAGVFFDGHPGWDERASRFRSLIAQSPKAQQLVPSSLSFRSDRQSDKTAIIAIAPIATASDAQSHYQAAVSAYSQKDFSNAIQHLQISVDAGFAPAQVLLGWNYLYRSNGNPDYAKAFRLLWLASDQGNANGQYYLGRMYDEGHGVEKNPVEAARLYKLSAEQGNDKGQFNLGVMYEIGSGVEKNPAEAVRLYKLSAEQGNSFAQVFLGDKYAIGSGIKKNPIEAVRLYKLSAAQGSSFAQARLGAMYASGSGVDKDAVEAFRLFRLSAEQDEATGQLGLGLMYAEGLGVEKNSDKAVFWFKKAAAQGNQHAIAELEKLGL